jgi:hypothetical protein
VIKKEGSAERFDSGVEVLAYKELLCEMDAAVEWLKQLGINLQATGFITADVFHAMAHAPGFPKWVTFRGEEFLKFIREPETLAQPEEK